MPEGGDKAAAASGGGARMAAAVTAYACVVLWIGLSSSVIMFNKYLLDGAGFPFPVSLTMLHMASGSCAAAAMVWGGVVPSLDIRAGEMVRRVVPIGALFAASLWLSNSAYLYLSVSFIQMLKALMPMAVLLVGASFRVESLRPRMVGIMLWIFAGTAVASYGELRFHPVGFCFQMGALAAESTRLVLVQVLLQRAGYKLNPVTTLYYVAPVCFAFLLVPFLALEAAPLAEAVAAGRVAVGPGVLALNCACALALNLAVFLLIGKTSALTMNVAGVVKDWLLIYASWVAFRAPISATQIGGYLFAFVGVVLYNAAKAREAASKGAATKGKKADTEPMARAQARADDTPTGAIGSAVKDGGGGGADARAPAAGVPTPQGKRPGGVIEWPSRGTRAAAA